jgi:hypothetical protein
MANYKTDPNTFALLVEIYPGVFSPTNPTTGETWANGEEAADFITSEFIEQQNDAINELQTFERVVNLQQLLAVVGEPTGFEKSYPESITTNGIIEYFDVEDERWKVDHNGLDWDAGGFDYFAQGTQFQTPIIPGDMVIYPMPYPHPLPNDARTEATFTVWVHGVPYKKLTLEKVTFDKSKRGVQYAFYDNDGELKTISKDDLDPNRKIAKVCMVYFGADSTAADEGKLISFKDKRTAFLQTKLNHTVLNKYDALLGDIFRNGNFKINGLDAGTQTYSSINGGKMFSFSEEVEIATTWYSPFLFRNGYERTDWDITVIDNNVGHFEEGQTEISYNENVAGNYQLTVMPVNKFTLTFFALRDDDKHPIVKLMGNEIYDTVQDAVDDIKQQFIKLAEIEYPTDGDMAILYAVIVSSDGSIQTLPNGKLIYTMPDLII